MELKEANNSSVLSSPVDQRRAVAEKIYVILSNTIVLANSTQSAHWNVVGSHFIAYHELFERQYQELSECCDELAERIRQLGFWVDGSMEAYLKAASLASIREPLSADAFLRQLSADHRFMSDCISQALDALEDKGADRVSLDLIQSRLASHEKEAWLLSSHIE